MANRTLIEQFVASFERLDEMAVFETTDPVAEQLAVGDPDEYGRRNWRPSAIRTEAAMLDLLYATLPARFPVLFEELVLSYRWADVDLRSFRLLANPPGPDLSSLLASASHDRTLWGTLIPAGYVQFGRGPDMDYDPVCFDIRSRKKGRDYRIVKIAHEEILCNNRIKVVKEIAPSFDQLVRETIDLASAERKTERK
jgi:hypothetical protein